MSALASNLIGVGTFLVLSVAGCSTIPGTREPDYVFNPPAAHAEVTFQVIDRRTDASKQFRETPGSPPSYKYADAQFFPISIRVIATHFAAAFPRAGADERLVIDHLEITNYVPRPSGDGTRHASNFIDAMAVAISSAFRSRERNAVTCRLAGTYGGREFDISQSVTYDMPGSKEHADAVIGSMLAAVSRAIAAVQKQDNQKI